MPYPRPNREGPIMPIVDPGQNVLLVDREAFNLYRVAWLEAIPPSNPLVIDIVAQSTPALANLGAGVTANAFNTTTQLDLNYGQFGQFRCYVLDDIQVLVRQPQGSSRYNLMTSVAQITPFTALMDPCHHLTEFFVLQQDRPYLSVTNPTQYALTRARAAFYGFKYILEGGEKTSQGSAIPPIERFANIGEALKWGHQNNVKFTVAPVGAWGR